MALELKRASRRQALNDPLAAPPIYPLPKPAVDTTPIQHSYAKAIKSKKRVRHAYYEDNFVQSMIDQYLEPWEVEPIHRYQSYWMARAYCGWDATSPALRDDQEPYQTEFWKWWKALQPSQREMFAELSHEQPCPGCAMIGPDGELTYSPHQSTESPKCESLEKMLFESGSVLRA